MPAVLTAAEIRQFQEEGWVAVANLLPRRAVDALRDEIAAVVDATASQLARDGRLANPHADAPFDERLARVAGDAPDLVPEFLRAIEGKAGGGHDGRAMFAALRNPRILDAMEQLVGPEIIASSVYRIRPKLPGMARGEVPWHQDSGYFMPHCDETLIVTVWIPLVDATPENGCLEVLPRAHRSGVARHYTGGHGGFLEIREADLPQVAKSAVTVPVGAGGALLLTNLAPHRSGVNGTAAVRWSIDLRYQSAMAPSNIGRLPEDAAAALPDHQVACYPPEADFIVRSRSRPRSVHSYRQFVERRRRYESASVPGPNRGWTPLAEAQAAVGTGRPTLADS